MSDKTEKPTPKKLREARQKGQVAHSKDFTQTILLLAIFGYFIAGAESIANEMIEMISLPALFHGVPFEQALIPVAQALLEKSLLLLLPLLALVMAVGVGSEMIQVGVLFAFEAVKPSGKKLNVAANLKNMFSIKNLVEFLKSVVKIVFLSTLMFMVIRSSLDGLVRVPPTGISGITEALGDLVKEVMYYTAAAYIVIAAFDYAWQRHQHTKGLMMSKDEVKREYKEMEGDPHIKSKRKHLHQEMMMSSMVQNARKASVVITNPTHIAVAIYYEKDETALPVVLAKATGLVAKRIVEVAQEEGIPIMQNVPLARALYEQADLNQFIPSELIEPVAEVLRWAMQLKQEQERGGWS